MLLTLQASEQAQKISLPVTKLRFGLPDVFRKSSRTKPKLCPPGQGNTMNPADLDVRTAGDQLRAGTLSAVDLAKEHLARLDSHDGTVRAFVARNDEAVLAAARKADNDFAAGLDRGPLQGIPVAVKDMIDTADFLTQYGSALYRGHRPKTDATCVARLKKAGAVILGKVATYEFATVGPSFDTPFPPACNPWSLEHITGGSSSGSAAAVAAGLVRIAIGTDTGGSVRSPAAYCGVVGLKPTFGAIPEDGVFPLSPSLDHVGVIAASVAEAELALSVLTGDPAGKGGGGRDLEGLKIAYARDWFAADPETDPGVLAAIDEAASLLSMLGAQIVEIEMPPYAQFEAAGAAILHAEAFTLHRDRLAAQPENFGTKTLRSLIAGACLDDGDLARVTRAASRLREKLDADVFAHCHAVLAPTTLAPAPALAAFRGNAAVWTAMRTIAFNVTGHPAMSLPAGFVNAMPVGLHLVGSAGAEALLCRIGNAFEQASDFSAQRAPHAIWI